MDQIYKNSYLTISADAAPSTNLVSSTNETHLLGKAAFTNTLFNLISGPLQDQVHYSRFPATPCHKNHELFAAAFPMPIA